jgi:hypothetical protein
MRRLLAVALLLAFTSPLVLPLFAATVDPEASLPACCRRHGHHHCAMMMAMLAAMNHPTFSAPPCPLYPTAATPVRTAPAYFAALPSLSVELRRELAPPTATPRRAKLNLAPTRFTRGPPSHPA